MIKYKLCQKLIFMGFIGIWTISSQAITVINGTQDTLSIYVVNGIGSCSSLNTHFVYSYMYPQESFSTLGDKGTVSDKGVCVYISSRNDKKLGPFWGGDKCELRIYKDNSNVDKEKLGPGCICAEGAYCPR